MDSADSSVTGITFNIQKYSVHDGPGIRTTVFLKGCPLSCWWCSNPESQKHQPQVAMNVAKCLSPNVCGNCIEVCEHGALENREGKLAVNFEACQSCLMCAAVCPNEALFIYGQERRVDEVIRIVEQDAIFYGRSGGGITLSGGEPLAQANFSEALLRQAQKHHVHTCMETCGYADYNDIRRCVKHLNTLIYDIKCIDSIKHKKFTGVSNEKIITNLLKIANEFPNLPIQVRTPIIPNFNDTYEDISEIMSIIHKFSNIRFELLPYHNMGKSKYACLGREYKMKDIELQKKITEDLQNFVDIEMRK
jgi:pyruvate formate lyase activating enzyme